MAPGNLGSTLTVSYPSLLPDWTAGSVVKPILYQFDSAPSRALAAHPSYDARKPDGTDGAVDGAFPLLVRSKATKIRTAMPESAGPARLVLLAYEGQLVPGELPKPEPITTGTRFWYEANGVWNHTLRTDSKLDTLTTEELRLTLIDDKGIPVTDGTYQVHACPRFDHEDGQQACTRSPVVSNQGQATFLLNQVGATRGYVGVELTQAPEAYGTYYLKVEAVNRRFRVRRQSSWSLDVSVVPGEYVGAFALCNVGDWPETEPMCGTGDCSRCKGSPCYVSTGTYETEAMDLSLPTSGLPLSVGRRYKSLATPDGPMGPGWTSSLESRLYYTKIALQDGSLGDAVSVVLPSGYKFQFVKDGTTGALVPPNGRYDTLVKNADGSFDLIPEGTQTVYRYDDEGRLDYQEDQFGNRVDVSYNASGQVQEVHDIGSNRSIAVSWNASGKISQLTDSTARTVTYGYDPQNRLTSVTDPAGRTTHYEYEEGRDTTALLTGVRDHWNRLVTQITYDPYDRTGSYSEAGRSWSYTYGSGTTTKNDGTSSITFDYTPQGLITSKTATGVASQKEYYEDGKIRQQTDEVGVKTFYTYASGGRVASVTRGYLTPDAVRFDYEYDPGFPALVTAVTPKDPVTQATHPDWQAWQYAYATSGALQDVKRVRRDGVVETLASYQYDPQGRVTRQTSAAGAQTDYTYDAEGNLLTVTAPANNTQGTRPTTSYAYDGLGRVTTVTDPNGKQTSYTYDVLGRVQTVTLPKPTPSSTLTFATSYLYDQYDAATGLVFTHVTDPNGKLTRLGYDEHGRLVRSLDALGGLTRYAYTQDLLTSITDANDNVTSYEYDLQKRLTKTTFPDGMEETYSYHADGLLHTKTDRRGVTVTYTYDVNKRLTQKSYSTGGAIAYTYQGQMLTQVNDTTVSPPETHTFGYDTTYRVTANAQGPRGTVSYTYGPEDRVATMTIQGGPTATYTYHSDGSLKDIAWSLLPGPISYTYTLPGQYGQVTLPNGQTRAYTYDDQGRLTTLTNALGGQTIAAYSYGYDADPYTGQPTRKGQRVSQSATLPALSLSGAATTYGYDDLYQLTKATYPAAAPFNGEVNDWTYDSIGNRLSSAVNGSPTSYTYLKNGTNPLNGQRLSSDGPNSYTHDAAGNQLTKTGPGGTFSFGYDPDNRLASISGSETASYQYDYQGRRVSKTVGGVTTSYLYDGLALVSETVGGGGGTSYFVHGAGIDEPLAMSKAGVVSYLAVDSLGSVTATTDATGTVTHAVAFDAWGVEKATTGTRIHPFTYTGREVGEAGSLFYRARFYQPGVGRFSQEDPLGLDAGTRLYPYVGSSPTAYSDPLGLERGGPPKSWPARDSPQYVSGCVLSVYSNGRELGDTGKGWKYAHCMVACELVKRCGLSPATVHRLGLANEAGQAVFCGARQLNCHSAFAGPDADVNATGYNCPPEIPCTEQCLKYLGKSKIPSEYGPEWGKWGWSPQPPIPVAPRGK